MSNMMDYLAWRGDVSMAYSPFNAVDSLILATISYLDYPQEATLIRDLPGVCPAPDEETITFFKEARALLCAAAMTERFAGIAVHHFASVLDGDRSIQFAAMTCDLPDGTHAIVFRGTDNSIVGWREDFNMAFESPVPAQTAAVRYLNEMAPLLTGELLLCGHSKGGNLAVYAASHAAPEVQARIRTVDSFDGPGLDDATAAGEGYAAIARRIRSFVPSQSVVGLLMTYHPEYTVVKSNAVSLLQHDTFTWQVLGTDLVRVTELDVSSQLVDQTVHAWLSRVSPEERRSFVTTVFDLLEASGATTMKDLLRDVPDRASGILKALQKVDFNTARMIAQLMGRFVSIGAQNVLELLRSRLDGPEELPEGEEKHV